MYFITIENQIGETVAINPQRITSITMNNDVVVICLGSQEFIFTKFMDLEAAVDYVERAYQDRKAHARPIKWPRNPLHNISA